MRRKNSSNTETPKTNCSALRTNRKKDREMDKKERRGQKRPEEIAIMVKPKLREILVADHTNNVPFKVVHAALEKMKQEHPDIDYENFRILFFDTAFLNFEKYEKGERMQAIIMDPDDLKTLIMIVTNMNGLSEEKKERILWSLQGF